MKKFARLFSAILAVAMVLSLSACGGSGAASSSAPDSTSEAPASSEAGDSQSAVPDNGPKPEDYEWPKFLAFLGASSGGNAILSISALGQVITNNLPTTVSAQVTPGASQNMYLMEQGDGNYAWGGPFMIYSAKNGLLSYKDDPIEDMGMNTILMYSNSTWQIAVRKGSGITCIEDLRGKKVVVGAAGGGTETSVRSIMEVLGLYANGEYDFQAEYSGVAEGCELISNGQADATICAGTIPFSSYMELFVTDKIELIGFTQEEVDKLEAAEIGQTKQIIPAGSYDGKVPNELLSVGSWSGLICKADCPEDEVYWITRTICENWEELGSIHEMFKGLSAKDAALGTVSPYADIHPGAMRYYQEMGWM